MSTTDSPPIWPTEDYFNWDYESSILTTGLVMLPLMMIHGFDMYAVLMLSTGTNYKTVKAGWNDFTSYAWGCMIGGNMTWNGFALVVWAFSFIESTFYQKSMFWSFVVAFGLSAVNLIIIDVFFIVGAVTTGGNLWMNLYVALINTVVTLGYHAVLMYALGPQIASFYRWHDQDWWSFGDFLMDETLSDAELDSLFEEGGSL